jgi:formylglycine-generating enzyme required for sulfatase activity
MFRQKCAAAFVALIVLASFSLAAAQEPKAASGEKQITSSIGMKLTLIPSGEFTMGSPDSEDVRSPDFHIAPQHLVRITRPFYMGVYDVTQGQYQRVMGNNPSYFSGNRAQAVAGQDTSRFPVEQVSWNDAVEFCRKLSNMPKEKAAARSYRLPTEAQWEYACRAGSTTRYYFGDDWSQLGEYAWYINHSDSHPHAVGQKKPNAWGLYDMHGNVWQWCLDWYAGGYYAESPKDDPTGPATGSCRVFRGGSWRFPAGNCQAGERHIACECPPGGKLSPEFRAFDLGFRVCLIPADK